MLQRILFLSILILFYFGSFSQVMAQQITEDEFVTYSRNSSFIKEFQVPVNDLGLRGITTDIHGNVWFHHSTSKASEIFKFVPLTSQFTKYAIEEKTQTSDAIISLSGGQLVYDKQLNVIWFTDARTNSIGKLHVESSDIDLYGIPTPDAGPMGLVLSPDKNTLWFSELNGNKIASLDFLSNKITEYKLKENSGPTFLVFDKDGFLWVTMSYSNSVLKINLDSLASDGLSPITELKLPKGDLFSPFGIAVFENNSSEKLVISDHGSSRVIVSNVSSNLNTYSSYWTSQSSKYPQTLPGQIVTDESGNVYFPQHGGNKISKLDITTGKVTEYDVPTGPLSTVVFIATDQEGKKIWFTEVLSNKIGYLDTAIPISIDVKSSTTSIKIQEKNIPQLLEIWIENDDKSSPISTDAIEILLTGMTHSGIEGLTYNIDPEIINLSDKAIQSEISIAAQDKINSGVYNIMLQVTVSEESDKDLKVSVLYPLEVSIEIPDVTMKQNYEKQSEKLDIFSKITLKDVIQTIALTVAIGLSAFIVLRRIKLAKDKNRSQSFTS
jgi:virginiamycin B lyase